jgi:hypothetical protein
MFRKGECVHEKFAAGREGCTFDFIILRLSNGVASVEAKFRKFLYLDEKKLLPLIFISRMKEKEDKFDLVLIEKSN